MKRLLKQLGDWIDFRVGFRETILPMMRHPVPREIDGPLGWWYVFGSASMTFLAIQILTGIGLALVYVPSAGQAYESLLYLDYQQPLGWFLRALALLRRLGHGGDGARAYDASLSARRLQVSA